MTFGRPRPVFLMSLRADYAICHGVIAVSEAKPGYGMADGKVCAVLEDETGNAFVADLDDCQFLDCRVIPNGDEPKIQDWQKGFVNRWTQGTW